jgi:hypothetical protein
MSDMTLSQAREAREAAERQIGGILYALHKSTGLVVADIRLRTVAINSIAADREQIVSIEASIRLELK